MILTQASTPPGIRYSDYSKLSISKKAIIRLFDYDLVFGVNRQHSVSKI